MERGQFTFYGSFYKAIRRIRKKSARADAYDAICAYALEGTEPDLESMDDAAAIAFEVAQPVLEASRRKAESGSKGGCAKQTASKTEKPASKKKDKDKDKSKSKNKCYPAGGGADADFDIFWAAYPKKMGKVAARRAFAQVDVPVEILVAALHRQKTSTQWCKDGGQFIPNPATWLSQGRWEDELPTGGIPKGASGQLGEAELQNIRRILSEET